MRQSAYDASPPHNEGAVAEPYDDETEGEPVEGETEGEPVEGETDDEPVEGETDDEPVEGETDDGEAGPEEITSVTPKKIVIGIPAEGVDWITSPCGADDSWNEYVVRLRPFSASVVLA